MGKVVNTLLTRVDQVKAAIHLIYADASNLALKPVFLLFLPVNKLLFSRVRLYPIRLVCEPKMSFPKTSL